VYIASFGWDPLPPISENHLGHPMSSATQTGYLTPVVLLPKSDYIVAADGTIVNLK